MASQKLYSSDILPAALKRLITLLSTLPGIGPKSARRLALYLFNQPEDQTRELADALIRLKEDITRCSFCNALSDTDPCVVCADTTRSKTKLLIVRSSLDRVIIEQARVYDGYYFVLDIEPSYDVGVIPQGIRKRLRHMLRFITKEASPDTTLEIIFGFGIQFEEQQLILALQDIIRSIIKEHRVVFSRFAVGIQSASDLDFVDPYTINEAYEGRRKL